MVTPITGPITWSNTETSTATVQLRDKRVGYKQAPPFNLVTPYHASRCTAATSATCGVSMLWDWISQVGAGDSWQPLQNLAYERFKDQALGVQAQVGANIGEWRESIDMVEKRALQLYRFTRAVRRLEFNKAARILRTKRPSTVSKAKGFGSNWLEYWLGWAPVIQDIYNAIDVLQGEPKPTHVRASARESKTYWLVKDYQDNPNSFYPSCYWVRRHTKWICERVVACGADIQVVNNNLNMANSLGLVNAASIAWELVPFSFVIDWFANVGDCLDTFTDFHGLTLSNEWNTVFLRGVIEAQNDYLYQQWVSFSPPRKVYGGSVGQNSGRGTFAQMSRTYGLPKVGLVLKPFKGLSYTRGATAISLLLQGLRG